MGESKFGQVSKLDIFVSLVVQSDQGGRLSERFADSCGRVRRRDLFDARIAIHRQDLERVSI